RSIALADLTRAAYSPPHGGLPDGLAPGLQATVYCDLPGPTFSGAVHVAVVEVDPATGRVAVRRYALVEDCGRVINPVIVEGQIHGAVAQGIGEALLEAVVHDDGGQLLTATLMDYALPRADDLPSLEIGHLETPSPVTHGGVKGMGEGGTIGAPATIANADADAGRRRQVHHHDRSGRRAASSRQALHRGDPRAVARAGLRREGRRDRRRAHPDRADGGDQPALHGRHARDHRRAQSARRHA